MDNKVAIVTGGNSGIGKAIAEKLSQNGYTVAITYRKNEEEAMKVIEVLSQNGMQNMAIKCDVTDDAEVSNMVNEVARVLGRVDVLVNNAGITKDTLIIRMSGEDFDDVINANLKGTFNFCKSVSNIMLKQKSGRIINISSVIGLIGNAGQVNYAASKAGIIGLTKSLAKELSTRGITVNAIAPGFIKTKMTDVLSEKSKEAILSEIPLKRFGEPDDIANLALFLSSDDASYITGQVINVDGGMVM